MKKLLILFGLLLLASPSFAADNAVIVTPGVGVTMKSKDIGAGVQAMQPVLSDTGGNALSTPTAGADAVSNTSTGLLAYDRLLGFNGTTWDRLQVDANKFLKMTLPSGAQIDLGSQADAACGTDNGSCSLIALQKRGNQNSTALNTTAAAPPGWRAQNVEQTATTNGSTIPAAADLTGKLIVLPYANPENSLNGQITSAMTGTTSTALTGMGAQGAGVRVYVTGCTFSNTHATVGTMINLQDGSGGAVLWQSPAAPAYAGESRVFPTPIKTTANTGLFAVNATTGSSTLVSCTGYKGV